MKLCKVLDFIKQVVRSDLCEWFILTWIQLHKIGNCYLGFDPAIGQHGIEAIVTFSSVKFLKNVNDWESFAYKNPPDPANYWWVLLEINLESGLEKLI
jgi:hypothetical protein